jgi:hypothetical protein
MKASRNSRMARIVDATSAECCTCSTATCSMSRFMRRVINRSSLRISTRITQMPVWRGGIAVTLQRVRCAGQGTVPLPRVRVQTGAPTRAVATCVGKPDLFARSPILVHACMAFCYVDGSVKGVQMVGIPEVTKEYNSSSLVQLAPVSRDIHEREVSALSRQFARKAPSSSSTACLVARATGA